VRLLVDREADVKAKNNNRQTVLHKAAKKENKVVVQLLIDKEADIKAKNNNRQTVLYKAA
jgi:ankyrin repeat protein